MFMTSCDGRRVVQAKFPEFETKFQRDVRLFFRDIQIPFQRNVGGGYAKSSSMFSAVWIQYPLVTDGQT